MNLSSEQSLSYQDLIPQLDIENIDSQSQSFLDLQPNAKSAVTQFLRNQQCSLLLMKAEDVAASASALEDFIVQQQPSTRLAGVRYEIEQADSFSFPRIWTEPAQSAQDNFVAQQTVASALYFDRDQLFGSIRLHATSKDIQLNAGLVHRLNNGVLILNIAPLLDNFELWQRLKQLLISKQFNWYSIHPFKTLPCEVPSYPLSLKIILLGSRTELATLSEFDEQLYQLADYAEINSYFELEQPEQQQQWAQYVCSLATEQQLTLDLSAVNRLYQALVRETEDRSQISIAPYRLQNMLSGVKALANHQNLSAQDFSDYLAQQQQQQGFLQEQSYRDIFNEQVYIDTEGEEIGQINGLSVIEYAGTPLSFGEPSRISCLVKFGDGELLDIERKNELAGNLHSKGMMIAEACLANILELPSQLPFSASLVFEQSYNEIDGDSASLAAFCVLVSALSELPLPQSIAVTGSIDQFGLVHAVGGVNQKIEGFFAICEGRGLTGQQGVIIPKAVCNQLSLAQTVVDAVKQQQFHIWAVEDVFQTCQILFKRALLDTEEQQEESISQCINQRITLHSEPQYRRFWQRLFGR